QASQIFANSPTAQIGSIGTFMVVYDMSEAAAKEGIKVHRFATGPLKGAGAKGTPLTEEQRAHLQQITDESQTAFDGAVKRGRGLTDKQLADVRTGGVWTAQNAMDRKLIDGVRPLGKTLDELVKFASTGGKAPTRNSASTLPMMKQTQTLPMLSATPKEQRHEL
ncbi:MAG TPA: S49 family peptidase, partial [Gemmataceae bacterium]|nr:S49 family peptidase [Gemmataceae bacterium]